MMNSMKHSVSVIIPTLSNNPFTVKSIPPDIEIIIERYKSTNRNIFSTSIARNIGAFKAKGEIIVFMDDDIEFSHDFFSDLVSSVRNGVVVGLKSEWHDHLISRALAMMREDFVISGGFDPLMIFSEDIEFSYRLEIMGFKIIGLPVDSVKHKPHLSRDPRNFILYCRTNLIIALKYPKYFKKIPRRFYDFFYHKIINPRKKELSKNSY